MLVCACWPQDELNGCDQTQAASIFPGSDKVCIYVKNSVDKKKKLLSSSPEIAKCCILSEKFYVLGILSSACSLLFSYIKLVNKTQQNKLKCYPVLVSHPSLRRQWNEAIIM